MSGQTVSWHFIILVKVYTVISAYKYKRKHLSISCSELGCYLLLSDLHKYKTYKGTNYQSLQMQ